MRKDLLQAISQMLKDLPPTANFNMGKWQYSSHTCGFAGCAIGWAIYKNVIPEMTLGEPRFSWVSPCFTDKDGHEWRGFEAVAFALDISVRDAEALFDADRYEIDCTPDTVALTIDHYLATSELPEHLSDND